MYYELWAEGLIISVGWFLKLEAKRGKWIVSQLLAAKVSVRYLLVVNALLSNIGQSLRRFHRG